MQIPKARLSSLQAYAAPIVLPFNHQGPDPTIKVLNGVQGTAQDLLQHLQTALQVGRFNRAEAIIQRLVQLQSPSSPEIVHAHTMYLDASYKALSLHGRGEQGVNALRGMQRWFEVEIKNRGVPIRVKFLVTMIRASIKALTGSERERTIMRYLKLAKEQSKEMFDEVRDHEEYDDNEFTLLGRVSYEATEAQEPSEAQTLDDIVGDILGSTSSSSESTPATVSAAPPSEPAEAIPEVSATNQRGEGLAAVKKSLEGFSKIPILPPNATLRERQENALQRQRMMEEASVEVAMERWRKADDELRRIGIHTSMQTKPINALMWQWYRSLLPALEKELEECKKLLSNPGKFDHDRYHYGPYLELLPLDKIAANTILHMMTKVASHDRATDKWTFEMKLPALTMSLAKAMEQEFTVDAAKQKSVKANRRRHSRRGSFAKKASKEKQNQDSVLSNLTWPLEAKVKFGAMLAAKLVETAELPVTRKHPRTGEEVTQLQPAFLHRFEWQKGKKMGMISPNPALIEKLETEPLGSLIAKRMPMVVEPQPWTGWKSGGYLYYSNQILRLPTSDHSAREYFKAADNKGDMNQIYAGLTSLGQVPWKISPPVFNVMLEAWNSGEGVANLAPLHPDFDLPPEPDSTAGPGSRRKWLEEVREIENKKIGLHSERCFQNFQMEIARTMLNDTLYFPHNMDFRGRAYPIPPYLNHMGADNVRGLLVFADGKRLGATGLRWLKIHLATVAGHDKASMSERLEFTMNHLDDIYDSVRNPLGGRRWWLEAEDAWQTLAACFELTAALDSPDPENFISHLPIQQDGTCNGLQHYAALGGDKIGAAQVNLEPGDRPADVYTAVAEAVKADVHQDAIKGNPIAQKLDGHLTRKCVKQPVMTNVYGVTWFGAKEQVQKQLEVIFPNVRKFDEVNLNSMSQYIATKIFKSLGTMFGGAQAIQHWLGQCADRISTSLTPEQVTEMCKPKEVKKAKKGAGRPKRKTEGQDSNAGTAKSIIDQQKAAKPMFKSTVVWTTPLRLPVVQPYRSSARREIKTSLQGISLQEPRSWHPVSKRKQLQAFPPNFIHSLDASHMLLSALKCKEFGMTFASVHDSFWTHACDVDRMGIALRDSFVEMHSDNIIGRLREEFQTRYNGYMYFATVLANSKVGKKITALRKEQKIKGADELALEANRMRLLSSSDEKERAEGAAMKTPGSLLASEADSSAFAIPAEISSQTLGTIPDDADSIITAEADEGVVGGSALDTNTDAIDAAPAGTDDPTNAAVLSEVGKSGKPKKSYPRKLFVWMPLTFPDIPPRGEFDVRKIRESNYFFH